MENTFTQELEGALIRRAEELNNTVLPFAFENYGIQITFVKIVRNLLLKKRLIHNDPYKYDSKMTEIEIPDSSPFMKTEAQSILGARLAQYETMLDFLMGYYQFNTDFLTPKRMQKLLALNATFSWSDFSPKSKSQNIVELYEIIAPIFSSTDKVSTTVLRGALSNLANADANISNCLRALLFFYRQKYKLSVRKDVMPYVKPTSDDYLNPSKILKEIKRIFALKAKKLPFYAEFVIEILKEDYSVDHKTYQEQVLQELFSKVKQETEKQKKIEDTRPYLLLALQALGFTGSHFAKALEKIRENKGILDEASRTFFKKFLSFLRQVFNIAEHPCEISIVVEDRLTQSKKRCVLVWEEFEHRVISKAMFFASLSTQTESMKKKIRDAKEEDLLDVLNRNLAEANELVSQLAGLDEYFKKEKPEIRSKIQGIKIELTTIKNYIIKSNQRRGEYLALCEEAQQMRELGMESPL